MPRRLVNLIFLRTCARARIYFRSLREKSCTESPRRNNRVLVTVACNICMTRVPRQLRKVPHAEYRRDRLSRTRATRAAAASGLWTDWHQSTRSVLYLRISHSRGRASALVLARSLARLLASRHVDSAHGQFHHGREDRSFFLPSQTHVRGDGWTYVSCLVHARGRHFSVGALGTRTDGRSREGFVMHPALSPIDVCTSTES